MSSSHALRRMPRAPAAGAGSDVTSAVHLLTAPLAQASQSLADVRRAQWRLPAWVRDVPVDPDAAEAARWAEAELADPIYHQRQSLLERAIAWILEQIRDSRVVLTGVDPRAAAIVVAALVVIGGLIALLIAGPVARARAAHRSADVFGTDRRTAAELRASADDLAARGLWTEAALDRFRAMLRSLEERALLDERPGRTAHEAAYEVAGRIPSSAADLHRAGRLFDDLCYGDAVASAEDDTWLRQVDDRLAASRPTPPAPSEAEPAVHR